MAHILIGRYRALTEAEAIVQDLVEQGFTRSQMTLVTPHAAVPASEHLGLQVWSPLEGTQDLERRFLDLGVPDNEVRTYTEAVRQGETLVVVHASAEQAECGLDILYRQRPSERQAERSQWQYLGHVGVVSHGDATRHRVPGTLDTPGLARSEAAFRQHQEAAATESGLTYMEYEPAYRYGYDVRAGNGGIPAPGSASKTLSGMAGTPSMAPSKPPSTGRAERFGDASGFERRPRMKGPGEKAVVCYTFFRQMALSVGRGLPCSSYAVLTST
jgi:hypothetical protein